jgi:hypothetical protein
MKTLRAQNVESLKVTASFVYRVAQKSLNADLNIECQVTFVPPVIPTPRL